MQFKKMSFSIFFLILIFAGCDSKNETSSKKSIENAISKENATFFVDLVTTNNETIKAKISKNRIEFESINDKVILLNFFATWCPPCKAEIPHLNALVKKYPNDFEVVAVVLEKNKTVEELTAFINEFNIEYKVTHTSSNYLLEQAVGGVKSIPTMFLLDKKGEIKQKYLGMVLEEMLEIDIKKAIGN
ncbi:MAG: TlpA disulfide reductase family protein [Arcobacteraceae bacterium]